MKTRLLPPISPTLFMNLPVPLGTVWVSRADAATAANPSASPIAAVCLRSLDAIENLSPRSLEKSTTIFKGAALAVHVHGFGINSPLPDKLLDHGGCACSGGNRC